MSTWSPQDETFARREQATLDAVIRAEVAAATGESRISVADAKIGEKVVVPATGRTATRVLYVTSDESILNPASPALDMYIAQAGLFAEVHVLVLRRGISAKSPVIRLDTNAWLYVAAAPTTWTLFKTAVELIRNQFVFADGFRPDVVIATDPYLCAGIVSFVSLRYDRPRQLHIGNYFANVALRPSISRFEKYMTHWLIGHFPSIRTVTDADVAYVTKEWPRVIDVARLPKYRHIGELASAPRGQALQNRYRQFSFVILYVGALGHKHTAFTALDAVRGAVRNPRVGFVIVGDGPGRSECQTRAQLLGISEHVVFERSTENILDYYLSADAVIVTDTDEAGDDVVVCAAAAGAPVVATTSAFRADLTTERTALLLAESGDVPTLERHILSLVNNNALRLTQSEAGRVAVLSHVHDDHEAYMVAYQRSIEEAILVGEGDEFDEVTVA